MTFKSHKPALFIGLMMLAGLTVLAKGIVGIHAMHHFEFPCLLILALVTSRLKVKLPGFPGNMSMNFPFVFLAIVQLSLFEAVIVASVSTLVQSLPSAGKQIRLVQILFNVSMMTTAAGLAYMVLRYSARHLGSGGSLSLVLAACTYFLTNTLPVGTIISLTEGAKLVRTCSGIMHLSLPYYVAGTGITSMVTVGGAYRSWALSLTVLPIMFGMCRSFRTYFAQSAMTAGNQVAAPLLARHKAAGAM